MGSLTSSRVVLNWIDGTWVGAPDIRQSINPATYEVIGEYADGGLAAAQQAVEAARRAFRETSWAVDHELRARARAARRGLRAQP